MAHKVKYTIKSDGTPEGTTLVLNGVTVTDEKEVTNIGFFARGGMIWDDGEVVPPTVHLSYRTIMKDGGVTTGEEVEVDINAQESLKKTPLGPPKQEVSDCLIGKDSELVTKIIGYKEKATYLPTAEDLRKRAPNSLRDMLTDLEAEFGK